MSSVVDVSVQPTTDPNMRAYHARFEMSGGPEVGTRGNSEELGEFGRLVLEIRGVAQVHVCSYVMLVTKAPLFEWSEIGPEVERLLRMFAASQRQAEEACCGAAAGGPGVERPEPTKTRAA